MIWQDYYYDASAAQEDRFLPQDVTFVMPFFCMHKIMTLKCVAGIEDIPFGFIHGVSLCKSVSLQVE